MNIGLIIFVISVIISIISAINDKSHKERQKQQGQNKQPRQQPSAEHKKPKSIFEQLGDKFEELQKEIDNSSGKSTTPKQTKPEQFDKVEPVHTEKRVAQKEHNERSEREELNKRSMPRNASQKDIEDFNALKRSLNDELHYYRTGIDREKEKQIALLEKNAQKIINDKYLSNRAKQSRLSQLFAETNTLNAKNESMLRFDEDEVLNGIIWSEILKKPKQLH